MARKQSQLKQNLFRWAFSLMVGVIAFFAAQPYGVKAPLGAPLPEVPVLIEYEGIEFNDSSVIDGRLNERLLELLAPQADGFPPLTRPYNSESAGFTIGQPFGTELFIAMPENFFKDSVLCQAKFGYDMPLLAIKYGLPEKKEGDKVTVFVSRLRREIEAKNAVFLARQGVLELDSYRFETLEYEMLEESGEMLSHYLYFGPFGSRVLLIDFVVPDGQHSVAKPFVNKIIQSFDPGKKLLDLLAEISMDESVNIDEGTEDNESSVDE